MLKSYQTIKKILKFITRRFRHIENNIMIPKLIILHHSLTKDTQTVSWNAIRRYHTNTLGWKDIGYHYGIELLRDHYEILLGRMLDETGAHTKSYNGRSIGICFIGNFDDREPPESQWNLGLKLVKWLMYEYKMDIGHIFGHNDFNNEKTCPGKLFDIKKFKTDLQNWRV